MTLTSPRLLRWCSLALVAALSAACGEVVPQQPDAPVAQDVTLTVTLDGVGAVTSSPSGIDCGSTCTLTVPAGTSVTLTATGSPGASVFHRWSGGGCGGDGTCQLTLTADTTVTAEFTALHALTVTLSGSGAGRIVSSPAGIDCPGACEATFEDGTVVTLTPTATTGSFAGWSGACSGTDACAVTMTEARSVGGLFARDSLLMDTAPVVNEGSLNDSRCDGAISTAIAATAATTITRLDADVIVLDNPTNVRFAIFDHATSTLVYYSDAVAVPVGRHIVESPPMSFSMTVGTRYHLAAMVQGCAAFPWKIGVSEENGLRTFSTNGNPTNYAAPQGPNECCSVDARFLIRGFNP